MKCFKVIRGVGRLGAVLFICLFTGNIKSQDVKIVSMTKYLSNCLYNFSRNINWPEENKSGDFVISIIGSKELSNEMTRLTQNMKVGMQPIEIKTYNTINDLSGFQHIVFVANRQSSKLNLLLQKVNGSSTLIVTETEGLIERGSMINFVSVNGLMQFEMNMESLKKKKLMASSALEKMASSPN
jgi:hypothetical protein